MENSTHDMFKLSLYDIAAKASGVRLNDLMSLATDTDLKEIKESSPFYVDGFQVSPRQYLIHVSENLVKPLLGPSYFGETLRKRIESSDFTNYFISDSGFLEESRAILGMPDVEVNLIKISRPGTSFEGDSRTYLTNDIEFSNVWELNNDSTVSEFLTKGKNLVS